MEPAPLASGQTLAEIGTAADVGMSEDQLVSVELQDAEESPSRNPGSQGQGNMTNLGLLCRLPGLLKQWYRT